MSKNTTNTLLAFAAGMATGAVLGILFAPEDGKTTRDKLSYQLSRYREKLMDLLKNLRSDADGGLNVAKEESKKVITEVTTQAEEMLSEIDNLMNQIKQAR